MGEAIDLKKQLLSRVIRSRSEVLWWPIGGDGYAGMARKSTAPMSGLEVRSAAASAPLAAWVACAIFSAIGWR